MKNLRLSYALFLAATAALVFAPHRAAAQDGRALFSL
jgi:hypothetical protein